MNNEIIAYFFTLFKKSCALLSALSCKGNWQNSCDFCEAKVYWLSKGSGNNKLAFNGTSFYKQNRKLIQTQQKNVWKSPHREKNTYKNHCWRTYLYIETNFANYALHHQPCFCKYEKERSRCGKGFRKCSLPELCIL